MTQHNKILRIKNMKKILAIILTLMLSGCSLAGEVKTLVGNDLARTSVLADKYGKPEVKQCADFLTTALISQDSKQVQLDALLAEPTDGLLSASLKAVLIAEFVRSLADPSEQKKFEQEFDKNCSSVAGKILLNIARDARKIGSRRIGL
mgnify:CR=1 FL=1